MKKNLKLGDFEIQWLDGGSFELDGGSMFGLAENALGRCGITVNKNMIPFDQRKPMDPSGVRIGSPALTTRGMGVDQMKQIGGWIIDAISNPDDDSVLENVRGQVIDLCQHFPVPAAGITV